MAVQGQVWSTGCCGSCGPAPRGVTCPIATAPDSPSVSGSPRREPYAASPRLPEYLNVCGGPLPRSSAVAWLAAEPSGGVAAVVVLAGDGVDADVVAAGEGGGGGAGGVRLRRNGAVVMAVSITTVRP
jgi:hypothetical protein